MIFIKIISSLAALFAVSLCMLKYIHFFQLNSYKFAEHKGYLKRNAGPLTLLLILSALAALTAVFGAAVGNILCAAVCLVYALCAKPLSKKSAKKPLVYTARVKRMLATEWTTVVIFMALWALLPARLYPVGIALLLIAAPYLCLWANIVNAPIEKAIQNHYINDAKGMLSSHPSLKVIGITGSYGKTGTKYILTTLLSEKYDVLMTPASYNTPMGVVKTVRSSLKSTTEIFVCEMGAKYVGDIKELCDIVRPTLGIITSVGAQHLETFGSLDNIVKTKFELCDSVVPAGGKVAIGFDNENIRSELEARSDTGIIKCGKDGDLTISNISADENGTTFTLTANGVPETYTLPLIGAHNVSNAACAIAIALELGMTPKEIKQACRRIEGAPHRLQLCRRGRDILIDDAYNANPAGTRAALDALSLFDGCRIIVTPGMIELGDEGESFNRRLGSDAAAVCDYIVLIGARQTKPIYDGALEAGFFTERIKVFERVEDGIEFALSAATDRRRIVLIENDLPDNY